MLTIARERIPHRNLQAVIESDFSEQAWDHHYAVVLANSERTQLFYLEK